MSIISVRNLTMDYGNGTIFENVSFDVEKGETVFIIGSSGCGKSTLLRCINLFNKPVSGEILLNNESLLRPDADVDMFRRKVGMVYQNFNLFSHLNIIENIILGPMTVLETPRDQAIEEGIKLLQLVGMTGKENNMPSQLSGGQKQRAAIARTLAMHPDVILFDEPTSALDPTMVDEVENVISDLCHEGMTSIIVSHDMRFVKNLASKVIFLAEKGIYDQGTPAEIFENPQKPLTQRFLYSSRMFERTLYADNYDLHELDSDIKKFLLRFINDQKHEKLIYAIKDELLYPMFSNKMIKQADFQIIASETSRSHSVMITFPELSEDPLGANCMDSLNFKILEHYCSFIMSKPHDNGYKVIIQM